MLLGLLALLRVLGLLRILLLLGLLEILGILGSLGLLWLSLLLGLLGLLGDRVLAPHHLPALRFLLHPPRERTCGGPGVGGGSVCRDGVGVRGGG